MSSKHSALLFNKWLLQDKLPTKSKQTTFEPPNKGIASEIEIQSSILSYLLQLEAMGSLFVQRINNTPIYDQKRGAYRSMPKGTHKGFPDIFVMYQGRCIFFEIKDGKGKQSTDQELVQSMLEEQGAEYYVVRSIDYVKRALGI